MVGVELLLLLLGWFVLVRVGIMGLICDSLACLRIFALLGLPLTCVSPIASAYLRCRALATFSRCLCCGVEGCYDKSDYLWPLLDGKELMVFM